MAKLTVFFVILFLVVVGLLAFFNKGSVDLTVWQDITYPVPVIALILISTAFGVLSMAIIVAIRDTRRYIESWQLQRQQKKGEKVQDAFSRGLEAFHASRYQEASELFEKVLEDEPAHLNALMRLGDIAFAEQDYTKAKDYYLRAMDIKQGRIEVLSSLEKVAEAQGKWDEAIKYLDDILEIDSENLQTLHKKREIFEITGKWEQLLELQQRILKCRLTEEQEKEENARLTGYKYEIGRHALESGDVDRAIKTMKGIIKSDTNFIPAYMTLADAYMKNGNVRDLADILLKGFETTSSLLFLPRLEKHYINEGEPGTIIDLYQKAVQKTPKDSKLQFLLAKLYYRLEMIDYAYDVISTIDMSSFDCPELHALLASIYDRRAEHMKAIEEFKKAMSADMSLLVPFRCSNCGHTSKEWSGRCPSCRKWNTFALDINEVCKAEKRQSST